MLAHSLASGLILYLPIANWARIGISLLLIVNLIVVLRREVFLNLNHSYVALNAQKDGWFVFNKRGESFPVVFQGDSFVSPALTILNFSLKKHFFPQHIVLMKGSLPAEEFRLLRVMIRWEKVKTAAKES